MLTRTTIGGTVPCFLAIIFLTDADADCDRGVLLYLLLARIFLTDADAYCDRRYSPFFYHHISDRRGLLNMAMFVGFCTFCFIFIKVRFLSDV